MKIPDLWYVMYMYSTGMCGPQSRVYPRGLCTSRQPELQEGMALLFLNMLDKSSLASISSPKISEKN